MFPHPNQRYSNTTNNYPLPQQAYSEIRSNHNTSSSLSSSFNSSMNDVHSISDNRWTTQPPPLPNFRDLFQDNIRPNLPNNHVPPLSNNVVSNSVACTTDQHRTNQHHSMHMWQEQHAPPMERNTFNRSSSHNSLEYTSIGRQTKPFDSSSNSSPTNLTQSPIHQFVPVSNHMQHEQLDSHIIMKLKEKISLLERELESQQRIISELQMENTELKSASSSKKRVSNNVYEKKPKQKRKTSPISNDQLSNNIIRTQTTFSLVEESNKKSSHDDELVCGGIDEFSVHWKGETFVLVDVFKNRTQIMNYFVPLYQSQYPDRNCKVVLSSEEYKQLFRENSHRSQSERKHAWRISIFTIDFYNFVKNQSV